MPRTFTAASSHRIATSLGAGANLSGAVTLAALVKMASNGTTARVFFQVGAAGGARWELYRRADNIVVFGNASQDPRSATTVTVADGWTLVVGTRPAGASKTPRFHFYKYAAGTWTHENAAVNNASDATPATSCTIGGYSDGTFTMDGDIAIAGAWAAELTDAQVEALAYDLPAWFQVQPTVLWILDQSATSQKVVDLTGGGANETGITGTSVSTGAVPVFSYGHPILVERVAATTTTHSATGTSTIDIASTGAGNRHYFATGTSTITIASAGEGVAIFSPTGSSTITIDSSGTVLNPDAQADDVSGGGERPRPIPRYRRSTLRAFQLSVATTRSIDYPPKRAERNLSVTRAHSRRLAHHRSAQRTFYGTTRCAGQKTLTSEAVAWIDSRNREAERLLTLAQWSDFL